MWQILYFTENFGIMKDRGRDITGIQRKNKEELNWAQKWREEDEWKTHFRDKSDKLTIHLWEKRKGKLKMTSNSFAF